MTLWHWDGGINNLEVQPLSPITALNEMGETLDSVLIKIKADADYRRMFKAAFGSPVITSQRMLKALAQFTGSLVSANSKYDKVKRGEDHFTAYEQNGYEIFKANCSGCHKEPLFTDNDFHNNGITLNRFNDIGRQKITTLSSDSLKFKTPSLRNVQISFPYMHDGRIYALTQVIEYYCNIDNTNPVLDPLLKNKINLSPLQQSQLKYFLYTLTDTSFTKNKRFSP
jgi:cytochrome c peroxidase